MTDEAYPADGSESDRRARLTAKRLTEALRITPAIARAIVDGELSHVQVVGYWPTGGQHAITSDEQLAAIRQCQRDIERYGVDAVRAAEEREARQR
jgi:hypothetical protein